MTLPAYVQGAWFVGALLFIFGLKGMSSPASARRGIVIAGYGMLIAIAASFLIAAALFIIDFVLQTAFQFIGVMPS